MTSLVKYGGWSAEEAAEQKKEAEASKGSGSFVKLKVGKNVVRFIPPRKGEKMIAVAHVHYVDIPGQGSVNFNCPRVMAKQHCEICARAQQLLNSRSEADNKKGRKLQPKRRCFANVIVRGSEEEGPKVLGFGTMIENALIEMREDEDIGGDFVHPINGFDVLIRRTGTTQNDTEYATQPANKGKQLPLHDDADVMNEWISSQPDLRKYTTVPTEEEIEEKLSGKSSSERGGRGRRGKEEEEEEEEAKPAKAKASESKPSGKRKPRNLDDEIDEGEIDD